MFVHLTPKSFYIDQLRSHRDVLKQRSNINNYYREPPFLLQGQCLFFLHFFFMRKIDRKNVMMFYLGKIMKNPRIIKRKTSAEA